MQRDDKEPPNPGSNTVVLQDDTEESKVQATFWRSTRIVADKWGEVGPAPPRVKLDRGAELATKSGVHATLRLGHSVFLAPNDPLPTTASEALRRGGLGIRGGWTLNVSGGGVSNVDGTHGEHRTGASYLDHSRSYPDYVQWLLTAPRHEEVLLRHVNSLLRPGPATLPTTTKWKKLKKVVKVAGDVITDLVPGVSNLKNLTTFLTGVNPVTGEKVGWLGRFFALVLAIPILGNLLGYVAKGGRWIAKLVLAPLVRLGMKAASKVPAIVKWVRRSRLGTFLGRNVPDKVRERFGRLMEKMGRRTAQVGHTKAWASMTKAEKRAFQHSYSRHAHEFGLPPWRQGQAEALRLQFNTAVGEVRQKAQKISVQYKPFNGDTVAVRFFTWTTPSKTKLYYYETLEGRFISAGRNR